jgi:hypothetical protein
MEAAATTTTLSEFAKLRGVSKPAVTKWKQRGLLVLTPDGRVDVAASQARLAERPDVYRGGRPAKPPSALSSKPPRAEDLSHPSQPPPAVDPSSWSTAEAVRRKEGAVARLRQIEADTAAGLVVPIADIAKAVAGEYAVVRAALLGMPSRLAHRLAAAATPEEAGALVDAEVRQVLSALTADGAKDAPTA